MKYRICCPLTDYSWAVKSDWFNVSFLEWFLNYLIFFFVKYCNQLCFLKDSSLYKQYISFAVQNTLKIKYAHPFNMANCVAS